VEEKRRKFSPEEKVPISHRHLVEKVALSRRKAGRARAEADGVLSLAEDVF